MLWPDRNGRIKVRTLTIELKLAGGMPESHSVIERQLPVNLPLILRVPLKELELEISKRPRTLFSVTVEITQQRVCVGEVCISRTGLPG